MGFNSMNTKKCISIMLTVIVTLLAWSGSSYADGKDSRDTRDTAATNWLVVVNYPEGCKSTPCTEADIFGSLDNPDNPNPTKATVCYLTGQVVRRDNRAWFAGALGEGHTNGCFFPSDADPHALKDSMRAEIHVIVQVHGEPLQLGYGLEDQLTQAGGGCNPVCADVQFAIHVPSAAMDGRSYSDLYRFSDESMVHGAKSLLIRDREGVRVVTQTKLD
jgi:hypothetical protein